MLRFGAQDLFLKTLSPFARRKVEDVISEFKAHSSTVKPISVQPKKGMQRNAAPAAQLPPKPVTHFAGDATVVDTFPLISRNGEIFDSAAGPPKKEVVRAQRSAAPPKPVTPLKGAGQGFAGVGIDFVIDSADRLVIGSLTPGGPAERKRTLAQGDVLISVDAFELVGQVLFFDDVLDLLRGEEGSDVILGFERPGKSALHCP